MASMEFKIAQSAPQKPRKGFVAAQVLLRTVALVITLAATCVMMTSEQSTVAFGIPIDAKYSYSPAFKFFALANAITCAFSLLSLIIVLILCYQGSQSRNYFCLFLHDMAMTSLVIAACGAATAIGYVGRYGDTHTGWMAICDQFSKFCYKVSISVALSYVSFLIYLVLTIISANESRITLVSNC